jgi:hypothetical protein
MSIHRGLMNAKERSARGTGALVTLLACALMAVSGASMAKRPQKVLLREDIPQGFAIGTASPVLGLKVDVTDGRITAVSPAAGKDANVRGTRGGEGGQTMLTIRTDLDVPLKFDLYVSEDGESFQYTSSCVVTPKISSFEMWEMPVREFALGNPRVAPQGNMTCD